MRGKTGEGEGGVMGDIADEEVWEVCFRDDLGVELFLEGVDEDNDLRFFEEPGVGVEGAMVCSIKRGDELERK